MSGTARPWFAGLPSTGDADFSAEIGNGSTPRNGAGSMATDAADSPRPARICVSRPPNEWPTIDGLLLELADHVREVIGDLPTVLWAMTSGCRFASSTVLGSSGQPGASVV